MKTHKHISVNKFMTGEPTLFLDQYGNKFCATTRKELIEKIGGGRVNIQYQDKKDGRTVQTGYVIGNHWLTAFRRVEL